MALDLVIEIELVDRGAALFDRHCLIVHGVARVKFPVEIAPDLQDAGIRHFHRLLGELQAILPAPSPSWIAESLYTPSKAG